jgi:hypothetical protein
MAGLPPSRAVVAPAGPVGWAVLVALVAWVAVVPSTGCNKAPAELDGASASSSVAVTAVAPLLWDAPGAWSKLDLPPRVGDKKAVYHIDKAANDTDEAECFVAFYGTGAKGDPLPVFKEWFGQFDGDVGATAARESFAVGPAGTLAVETVEATGTFKIALTPKPRGRKEAPVQMVKSKWRLYGAVVKTPDRGNWFFKLVGPDDTVLGARSAFRAMLESAR